MELLPFRSIAAAILDAQWGVQLSGHHAKCWTLPALGVMTDGDEFPGWRLHRALMALRPPVFCMVSIDEGGRVVIPEQLRRSNAPQPGERLYLIGQASFLEIWPRAQWRAAFASFKLSVER